MFANVVIGVNDIRNNRGFKMKKLKFVEELIELVISGEKNTTWRLFDDKELHVNDVLSMINSEDEREFAKAKIISVKETTFENLSNEDKKGHEAFENENQMLQKYSEYYSRPIKKHDILKVVRFSLINQE